MNTRCQKIVSMKPTAAKRWTRPRTSKPPSHPKKNRAGNRTYQRKDIVLILRIKHLLYDEGFTIKGARDRMKAEQSGTVRPSTDGKAIKRSLKGIREELQAIVDLMP